MKTVLLTGATGFIGQTVVRPLIEKDYIVHAVSSRSANSETIENLFWHQTNLLDAGEVTSLIKRIRPTHLLHFAWYVEPSKVWNAAENLDWLRATLHLAKTFVENGGKRMVASGTCAEYDWRESGIYSESSTDLKPQHLYGTTKHALNTTLTKYAEISDLSYAWGRVFFLFGSNEYPQRLVSSVIRALLKNELAKTSHGNQVRDFSSVEYVGEAFVELLESDVCGDVNIASGKGVKLKELVEMIAGIIGKPELLRIGDLPAPALEPPEIVADVRKLREEVRFNKIFDLKESLEKTINWWKKNL